MEAEHITQVSLTDAEIKLIEGALHKSMVFWETEREQPNWSATAKDHLLVDKIFPLRKLMKEFEELNLSWIPTEVINEALATVTTEGE